MKDKVDALKGEKRPGEKWQEFVDAISCEINREFAVLVKLYLRGYPNTVFDNVFTALERLGVESKTREMVKEEYCFLDATKLKIGENGRYLLVRVSAHDRFSAATRALQKMSEALNMVSFFEMIEGWNVKDTTLFVIDGQTENVEELYGVFQERDRYLALLQACEVNKLLKNRCMDICKLATDAKAAGQKVIRHHENVEWQLQRLYRFRNEIAHSALRKTDSLLIYIEHLYDYLMTFVSEIVTCVDKKSTVQMRELMPIGIIDLI